MTATIVDNDTRILEALDVDLSTEVPCGYAPEGEVICPTSAPARWRLVYYAPCGCYTPQLICEDCRHAHRLYEIKIGTLLQIGIACVHCGICHVHIDHWHPAAISPIARPCP